MDKAKELAILILKKRTWTVEAINEAMKGKSRPSIS
jgi:hypothetical protein